MCKCPQDDWNGWTSEPLCVGGLIAFGLALAAAMTQSFLEYIGWL